MGGAAAAGRRTRDGRATCCLYGLRSRRTAGLAAGTARTVGRSARAGTVPHLTPSQPPHSQPSHQTFYHLVSLLLFRRSYIKVCLSKSLKRFSKLYSREQLYRSSKVIQQLIRGRYSSNSNLKTFVSQVQSFIILVSQRSSLLVFTIRRSLVFLNLFKNKLLGFLKVYNKS